ncbi:M1 family aminopeptidase [Flagellimonas eckloniae]|nr:M1 family aminopeptidase [Allomuricauda eckloniae]
MKFPADSSGTTILEFNNEAWGQKDLFNTLHNVQLIDVDDDIEKDLDSGWIILKHPKNLKTLEFEYDLKQDFYGNLATDKAYRPVITEDYFHVFSHNLFMFPKTSKTNFDITLDWIDFPEQYTIHNSFGSKKRNQFLENMDVELFESAIFVGGDFRILEDEINGNAISLATRGEWVPFGEKEVMQVLKQTLKCQRDFWEDHSQEYFTVTMQPFFQETGSSFQGTGLTNSFATSVSNNDFTDIDQMVYLFNHELMHNWIGNTIENENEEEQYWFSEGFTEYYTYKNVAKNKIKELDGAFFINSINETAKNLHSLSIKEVPNSEMNYENFWSDYEYRKLPYYRGTLFAFYLDYSIQKDSNGKYSLDNVMKDLLKVATDENKKLNHTVFKSVLKKYFPNRTDTVFKEFIVDGKLLPLADFYNEMKLEYEPTTQLFELGFELSEDGTQVDEVNKDSEAWKAGLRSGDKLYSRSIWYGNISKKVELGVLKEGNKVAIDFYPVKMAEVPQIQISEENTQILGF